MRVHHLAFRTFDVARLEAFYVEVLGFRVARRDGARSTWLVAGDARVMLERAEPTEARLLEGSCELVAFAIAKDEAAVFEGRLVRAGATIEARTAYTFYVRDPDGRRIAFSHYAFEPAFEGG